MEKIRDGPFDASGMLPPGIYEMGSSCAADEPATCDASFSTTFRLQP